MIVGEFWKDFGVVLRRYIFVKQLTTRLTLSFYKESQRKKTMSLAASKMLSNSLTKAAFEMWKQCRKTRELQELERFKLLQVQADKLAQSLVPRRFLRTWKQFVKNQKDERWRQHRREMLQRTVQVSLASDTNLSNKLISVSNNRSF